MRRFFVITSILAAVLLASACENLTEEIILDDYLAPTLTSCTVTPVENSVVIDFGASVKLPEHSSYSEAGFIYGYDSSLSDGKSHPAELRDGSMKASISPNRYGSTLYCQAFIRNRAGQEVSSSISSYQIPAYDRFVTLTAPEVQSVTSSSVTVSSYLTTAEGISIAKRGFCYVLEGTPTVDDSCVDSYSLQNELSATISGLGQLQSIVVAAYSMDSDGNVAYSSPITVTTDLVHVDGVTLNYDKLSLAEGQTETLIATITPSDAANKNLSWKSSNTSVATVDVTGKVSAVKAGTATVTVTTEDGGKTATCVVTVVAPASGVSLNKSSLELIEGASETLVATITPADASNKNVSWKSSNTSVAKVDATGKVTAVKAGTATITVTTEDGGKTATCEVTVIAPASGVSLNKSSLELIEGASETLVATITPANASNKNVSWKSSNTSVAKVDASGKVTAVKAGTATITVTTEDGGKTATCEVTVIAPASGVSLNKSSLELIEGASETLVATITPANASNKNVSWRSSNTSVAKVDATGKVSAVKSGSATITVTTEDGGYTATCEVTVKAAAVDPSKATDLSSSGTANCYIVSAAGDYKFKTVKGNTTTSVGYVSSASVVWETYGTSTAPNVGDLVNTVSYSNGYITFRATGKEGNALIAAKDASGNILWSWHIWCTDKPSDQVYKNGAGTMMDRNLGATSATPGDVGALGLLYQWGRKDPFLGSSSISSSTQAKSTITWPSAVSSNSSNGTIAYATSHPTTFITRNENNNDWYYTGSGNTDDTRWNSSKGTYDPCPPGYRVPDGGTNGVWSKALGSSSEFENGPWSSTNRGMDFKSYFTSSTQCWYPASGYIDYNDGSLKDVGYSSYYWSKPNDLGFISDGRVRPYNLHRAYCLSVRCIKEGSMSSDINVSSVSLNKTSLTLTEGDTETLTATISPSNATNKNVSWKSSNTSVATVSSSGKVTAVKAGTATITVTTNDGGKTATCVVTVKSATVSVTGVSLSKTSLNMVEGQLDTLTVTITPSNATNKNVSWKSSNTTVATVSTDGTVTALKAGTATITVTTDDGGKTATCSVTVKAEELQILIFPINTSDWYREVDAGLTYHLGMNSSSAYGLELGELFGESLDGYNGQPYDLSMVTSFRFSEVQPHTMEYSLRSSNNGKSLENGFGGLIGTITGDGFLSLDNNPDTRLFLNLWSNQSTDQANMFYANIDVEASCYSGDRQIASASGQFHVRFMRPLEMSVSQGETSVLGAKDYYLHIPKISLTDWDHYKIESEAKCRTYGIDKLTCQYDRAVYATNSGLLIDISEMANLSLCVKENSSYQDISGYEIDISSGLSSLDDYYIHVRSNGDTSSMMQIRIPFSIHFLWGELSSQFIYYFREDDTN